MTVPFDKLRAELAADPQPRTLGFDRTPRGERAAAVLMLFTRDTDPALTFALREALYGLSAIVDILAPDPSRTPLAEVMETAMQAEPANWRKYYAGTETELAMYRHYSFSDRVRYYWPVPAVDAAVNRLMETLGAETIPLPLIGQFLGRLAAGVASGRVQPVARDLVLANIGLTLDDYDYATDSA